MAGIHDFDIEIDLEIVHLLGRDMDVDDIALGLADQRARLAQDARFVLHGHTDTRDT